MAHTAFEKANNLIHGAGYYERLALEAEANNQTKLAIKYYNDVIGTALGLGRALRARDAIARLKAKQKLGA